MKGISIKEATRDNIEALKHFLLQAWREAGPDALGWTGATDEQIFELTGDVFLSSLIKRSNVTIFLALTNSKVVGFASNTKVNQKLVELSGIIVLENMRGQGIGTLLPQSAIRSARKHGYNVMTVKTELTNDRAIRFYNINHFKLNSKTSIEINGKIAPLIELTLYLKKQSNENRTQIS